MSPETFGHVLPVMEGIGGCALSQGFSVEGGEAVRQESPGEETDKWQRGTFPEWTRRATEAA